MTEINNDSDPYMRVCPVCGRPGRRLRKDGTIWNHTGNAPYGSARYRQNCSGSGKPPVEKEEQQ